MNRDAARVYLACRRQLIFAGMGRPVDINHLAVHEAMRLFRVRDAVDCFEKVLALAGERIAEMNEQAGD
ncbi:hypothetical protein NNJEOMEG_03307 [Fundidesulfovibrio magnetotacticus]|uniref:Uncharacterized protein n=1 Tax=Fundidesulfovibrio magnetotacticus TaxID=2730080 RepID=A0A6V8LUN2_9BACT|nr:hypothetical protein [Fundidesulfovibrio magnetotacticus]GFK95444.1 hypothetical protein NNJEOMEG_03307 [Fundidesulfovibrio magnetotacticus]